MASVLEEIEQEVKTLADQQAGDIILRVIDRIDEFEKEQNACFSQAHLWGICQHMAGKHHYIAIKRAWHKLYTTHELVWSGQRREKIPLEKLQFRVGRLEMEWKSLRMQYRLHKKCGRCTACLHDDGDLWHRIQAFNVQF